MYLRAQALDGAGNHKGALDDYATTIELFANKKNVSSTVFVNMSKAYAALGRFCEAISPIETWIALDPINRDTSQAERLTADYSAKGNCGNSEAKRPQRFPLRGGTNVAVVKVEINGAAGFFILDTGASFVSVQQDFAKRAHLQIDLGGKMALHTANGGCHRNSLAGRFRQARGVHGEKCSDHHSIVVGEALWQSHRRPLGPEFPLQVRGPVRQRICRGSRSRSQMILWLAPLARQTLLPRKRASGEMISDAKPVSFFRSCSSLCS